MDYESERSYDIMVTTQDSGSPSMNLTVALTIEVTDVNDPPDHLVLNVNSLHENTEVGQTLGTLEVCIYRGRDLCFHCHEHII